MSSLYAEVAQRARHRCESCHAPEVVFNFSFEAEHIDVVQLLARSQWMRLGLFP